MAVKQPDGEPNARSSVKPGFPIVGIGASAGGLAAFEEFFRSLPNTPDLGMAFVLVQHLAPDHTSILTELIRSFTQLKVYEVEDGMVVMPNCVYVIPPNHDMGIVSGVLQLLPPSEPRGQRLPIDYFFSSLAQDQRQFAIGCIFSGTGSDGSQGVRAIKNEGGMVMVQSPDSTEFDGMPRAAVKTGVADFVAQVSEMPAQLLAYVSRSGTAISAVTAKRFPEDEIAIHRIFALLRSRTGHDFSMYKPNTIDRRIERRMAVNHVDSLEAYVKKLQENPIEIELLFQDMLIGVTSFFRDHEAFAGLEKYLSQLIEEKLASGAPIRVWVGGCSTGEEAYSIAILLREQLDAAQHDQSVNCHVQIFASDMDPRAIAIARAGLYPQSISEQVPSERLARFLTFEPTNAAYRVHKRIREMVIFSEHDVNKDPPFSKLDLISCRNLMIYLGNQLQRRLIPLFHFALNPNGLLFLGSSEGIGDFEQLFSSLDRKAKLYRRKPDFEGMPRATLHHSPVFSTLPTGVAKPTGNPMPPSKVPLRELAERTILTLLAPAAALVNEKGDILYLLGRTGMFLEPTAGEASVNNILKMGREGLRHQLATALHKVVNSQQTLRVSNLLVKTNGHYSNVEMSICPVNPTPSSASTDASDSLYLVLLAEMSVAAPPMGMSQPLATSPAMVSQEATIARDSEALIASLNAELQAKEEYLHSAYEELESANEELKSSNEEMQSVNEELQSTNEELETSKEELQSINEELATVNTELQNKVTDLSRLNNDMNNLLSGSGIATIFVDHQLCILRFTPTMAQIINLIGTDVGRPVAHIVSNLVGYDSLVADAKMVLDTLESKDRRVQTSGGNWFHMRIKPYRTIENVIEGVVITFVDITDIKRVEDSLEKANRLARLAVVVRDASDAITVQDLEGRTIAWNPSATELYGWSEEEALQMNVRDRIPPTIQQECLAKVIKLSKSEKLEPYRTQRLTKSGRVLNIQITATALENDSGVVYAIATTERMDAA
ncbi:MAG: chemotaxis protein CheB [Pirellulaceae bacterium]|nr:chemotaxis protein CheB [Pirellulaceae bacterium]